MTAQELAEVKRAVGQAQSWLEQARKIDREHGERVSLSKRLNGTLRSVGGILDEIELMERFGGES